MPQILYQFVASGVNDVKAGVRSIRDETIAADRASRQRASSSTKALSLEEKRYREVEKYASRVEAQLKREADVAAREAKRGADASIREAKRAADAKAKAHEHVFQIRQRYEAENRRQEQRAAAAQARAQQRTSEGRMRAVGRLASDAAFAGVGLFGAGLGVVGGAAREGVRLQDASSRLAINARGAGQTAVDANVLRREFEAAALGAPGIKAADIAEGAGGFVAKTGDLAAARRFSGTFATVASATGSDVQDIAGAAADLLQKFDITGIEEMRDALAALTFQGKAGAFELKDAASQFSKMSAAAERFGLAKGSQGLRTLGGLTQIARSATGSPEQASTAVEAMFRQLITNSKMLTAVGASPFEKGSTTKTRDIRDVLVDAISKNKGSLPALQKVFGEEGIRGISPLISTYNEAEQQKTGTGVKALRDALAKAIDAPGDWAEVVKDAAMAQRSSGAQLDAAWESLKIRVSAEVVPALITLVPKLAALVEGIDPLITVFGALVEGAGYVVEAFKELGIIKDRRTPEQKLDKAQKDLADFESRFGRGAYVPTAAEVQQREQLQASVEQASLGAYGLVGKGDKITKPLSIDAFAERYAELGGGDEEQRRAALLGARGLGSKIAGGTASSFIETNDTLQSFLGENQEQQRLRQRFQSDVAGGQGAGAGAGGSEEMKAAARELTAAASELKNAAAAKQAPSVFDGK